MPSASPCQAISGHFRSSGLERVQRARFRQAMLVARPAVQRDALDAVEHQGDLLTAPQTEAPGRPAEW